MNSAAAIEKVFSDLGATFLLPAAELGARLRTVRALVFDWDGVFNAGAKGDGQSSTFSEADSMGTNLLRYALWREHGALPVCAVITGASNPSARQFATREHFSAVYSGIPNKDDALAELCSHYGLEAGQVACVFDDANDLSVAMKCGLRFFVSRDASPLLHDYVQRQGLCDYITAASSGNNAVREIAELLIGLLGTFDAVLASRIAWDDAYAEYFSARQAAPTQFVAHGPR
jgi:3-deoxy-D-manno-octulosonate 8-phosphate phosphatase (KDO 8-P phosphatase)